MSVRTARMLVVLTVLLYAAAQLVRWIRPFGSDRWLSTREAMSLFMLSVCSGVLASARCEADVRAGRVARWAYAWDWTQLALLLAAASLFLGLGGAQALVMAGLAGLNLAIFAHGMRLRRRRARAAWTAESVGETFT